MKSNDSDEARRNRLRNLAEEQVKSSSRTTPAIPQEDVVALIHELEVHQVELEMQNEELRRSQLELEESQKKHFDLYDLAPVGYVALDRKGDIQEINLTGAALLGREQARLKRSRFALFVEKSQREEVYHFCQRLFAGVGREEIEVTIKHGEKAPVDVLLTGVANPDPNLGLCQVAMTDITARKEAESWRRKLVETTQDAVIAINRRAQIVLFNQAAEKMFGYAAEEIIGRRINVLMPEPYASEHDRYIDRYERTGETRAIGKVREVAGVRKNGEVFPIEISITEIDHEVRYVALLRDMSEKAELQAMLVERGRLASVTDIASKVVHEIANPLNGMAMSLELLERRTAPGGEGEIAKMFTRLRTEVSRLKNLLNDFRSFSSGEKYDFRPVDIAPVVQNICSLESASLTAKGIRIEIHIAPGLPPVLADRDKLNQAILNLCKNAEEAMPDGGKLTIRCYQLDGKVNLEVSDTGIGVPEDFNLFEAFKTSKPSGSGLGLLIVREIVSRHQGLLSYTSERGKGSTFRLTLPAYLR